MPVTNQQRRSGARREHNRDRAGGGTRPEPVDDAAARQPPHDLAAERALLGACLLGKPELVTEVRDALGDNADPFYDPRHAMLWRTVCRLADQDITPDPVTVADAARTSGEPWRDPEASVYLHQVYADAPLVAHPAQLRHHCGIVTRYALTRRFDLLATRMRQAVQTGDHDRLLEFAGTLRDDIDAALTQHPPISTTDTWTPVDLVPALTGGVITPPPALLAREDGICLLYPGRLHSISGEPEAGKTWAALVAVLQALQDRQHVLYLDFEDTPEGIVGRLLAMGAEPDQIREYLHYIRPDRPIDGAARATIAALVEQHFVTVAIIDGVTEAMTVHGLDPYNNPDAAKFYEALPRFITRLPRPPAVLLIDHVPKDEDRPKRYAIGAQHKLAGLDGAAYMVDIVKPFSPGQPGISRIRVAKDRPGQVRKHAHSGVIAELHVKGDDLVVSVELRPPLPQVKSDATDGHWRPTILMEKVSRWLEINPRSSLRDIEAGVRGRGQNIRAAVEALVIEGYARREPAERGRSDHYSVRPFRNAMESQEIDNDGE